jgi:hypothetical protein
MTTTPILLAHLRMPIEGGLKTTKDFTSGPDIMNKPT